MEMSDIVPFKIYLENEDSTQNEVRRFGLHYTMVSFNPLANKLHEVFPKLSGKVYTIYWKDEDNDNILISNDDELFTALGDQKSSIKKLHVSLKGANSNSQPDADAAQSTIICDGCNQKITGCRFKCVVCINYDLCRKCEKEMHFEHPMVRLSHPMMMSRDNLRKMVRMMSSYGYQKPSKLEKKSHVVQLSSDPSKNKRRCVKIDGEPDDFDKQGDGKIKKLNKSPTNLLKYFIDDMISYLDPFLLESLDYSKQRSSNRNKESAAAAAATGTGTGTAATTAAAANGTAAAANGTAAAIAMRPAAARPAAPAATRPAAAVAAAAAPPAATRPAAAVAAAAAPPAATRPAIARPAVAAPAPAPAPAAARPATARPAPAAAVAAPAATRPATARPAAAAPPANNNFDDDEDDEVKKRTQYLKTVGNTIVSLLDPLGINVDLEVRGPRKDEAVKKENRDYQPEPSTFKGSEMQRKEVRFAESDKLKETLNEKIEQITDILAKQMVSESPEKEDWVSYEELKRSVDESSAGLPDVEQAPVNNPTAGQEPTPIDEFIAQSLEQMLAMGFTNEGDWLKQLLETKKGDIYQVVEALTNARK